MMEKIVPASNSQHKLLSNPLTLITSTITIAANSITATTSTVSAAAASSTPS